MNEGLGCERGTGRQEDSSRKEDVSILSSCCRPKGKSVCVSNVSNAMGVMENTERCQCVCGGFRQVLLLCLRHECSLFK